MKQHVSNDPQVSEQRKSNIGVRMTIIYSIVYSGFVVLSVFMPTVMGVDALFGLNLAIAYGLALIIIAIIFAIIYNLLVRVPKPTNATHRIKKSTAESLEE